MKASAVRQDVLHSYVARAETYWTQVVAPELCVYYTNLVKYFVLVLLKIRAVPPASLEPATLTPLLLYPPFSPRSSDPTRGTWMSVMRGAVSRPGVHR